MLVIDIIVSPSCWHCWRVADHLLAVVYDCMHMYATVRWQHYQLQCALMLLAL